MSFLQAAPASWSCARNLGGGEAFWPGSVDGGILVRVPNLYFGSRLGAQYPKNSKIFL